MIEPANNLESEPQMVAIDHFDLNGFVNKACR